MEPNTLVDILINYLHYHQSLLLQIQSVAEIGSDRGIAPDDLINNDPLAIAMARVQYERAPGALPQASDFDGIWNYYKLHYNSLKGAATKDVADACYKKYVLQR